MLRYYKECSSLRWAQHLSSKVCETLWFWSHGNYKLIRVKNVFFLAAVRIPRLPWILIRALSWCQMKRLWKMNIKGMSVSKYTRRQRLTSRKRWRSVVISKIRLIVPERGLKKEIPSHSSFHMAIPKQHPCITISGVRNQRSQFSGDEKSLSKESCPTWHKTIFFL